MWYRAQDLQTTVCEALRSGRGLTTALKSTWQINPTGAILVLKSASSVSVCLVFRRWGRAVSCRGLNKAAFVGLV